MTPAPLGQTRARASTTGFHGADRLARYALGVLLIATALGILGGVLSALEGPSSTSEPIVQDDPCPEPPCFDFNLDLARMPPSAIPSLLQLLGYTLAAALGIPGLLAGGRDVLRGRPAPAAGRLLALFGPLLVLVGTELVPHVIDVCPLLPWICADHPRHGWSITEQWHQLDHALVGAVPLTGLYGWTLRRWHPALATSNHGKDAHPMAARTVDSRASTPGQGFPRAVALLGGAGFVALGAWAMMAPRAFFEAIAHFEPYNQHFVQDIGAFQIGLGAVLLLAAVAAHADALAAALLGVGVGAALHTLSHVVGRDLGGTPQSDIPTFAFMTLLLLAAGVARWRDAREPAR